MVISRAWHVDPRAATGDRAGSAAPGREATGIVDTLRCGYQDKMFDEGQPASGSASCPATPATAAANGRRRGRPSQTPAASTTPVPVSRRPAAVATPTPGVPVAGLPGGQAFWF